MGREAAAVPIKNVTFYNDTNMYNYRSYDIATMIVYVGIIAKGDIFDGHGGCF